MPVLDSVDDVHGVAFAAGGIGTLNRMEPSSSDTLAPSVLSTSSGAQHENFDAEASLVSGQSASEAN